jgi:tetratricopeptide (TPR) repeat protein
VGLEDFDRAKEEAAAAIQLDKKEVTAYNAAGLAAYYVGDLGEAVVNFSRATELDPTRHESHTNLGLAYFQMRSWNRARDEFKAALKYLPEAVITNTAIQRSYLLYLVALTYSNIGLYEEAVASLNEALAMDPNYFEALRQLARDYASLANYRAAERALRRALQQSPGPIEDADVLSQLGLVYETAGQPHQAVAAYSEAITKDPNNAAAQKGFARLQAF